MQRYLIDIHVQNLQLVSKFIFVPLFIEDITKSPLDNLENSYEMFLEFRAN